MLPATSSARRSPGCAFTFTRMRYQSELEPRIAQLSEELDQRGLGLKPASYLADEWFAPEGSGTRVELEHRNLERLGDSAEGFREAIDSSGGWGALLKLFAEEAAR